MTASLDPMRSYKLWGLGAFFNSGGRILMKGIENVTHYEEFIQMV